MSKKALVTGASSGIGLEFARILARGGYDLFIAARTKKALEELATELHDRYETEVEVMAIDLSKTSSAEKLYEVAIENGPVDVLINNAGFGDLNDVIAADWGRLHKMINLNIMTLTHLAQLAAKDMVNRKNGKILNVASTASFVPGPRMAVYHASKAYVMSFSVSLAEELKGTGVTVTTLNPGITRSGFQKAAHLENVGVFANRDRMPTSYEVALFGYEAMMNGRTLALPGIRTKLMAHGSQLLPRTVLAKIVYSNYKRGN